MVDDTLLEYELPGAGYDFQDVTELFQEASSEMEPNNVLFMENFTLQEAMSALEIGEPRLDTGLIVQEQIRPPFEPLTPLLPEELCWILDRAAAYESQFHAGNFLAHTVHTFLYVHHLPYFDSDILVDQTASQKDPARPRELITIVLRPAVQALLKCCDFAWRELARGGAYDTEDWQSDKSEVSLLEGMPVHFILMKLDDGMQWLEQSSVPKRWKDALKARLLLRKTLLQIMSTDPVQNRLEFQTLVFLAKDALRSVQATPPPTECLPDSPAQLAFDPYIGRGLQMAVPIRIITPPSFEETCAFFEHFLNGLYEVGVLETMDQITSWEIVGNLRACVPGSGIHVPYIRSLTQTTFFGGVLILNRHSLEWMLDRFFVESVGVDYEIIKAAVNSRYEGSETGSPFRKVERSLYKLITPHIRALWNNPPRRRRFVMKSLVEWHTLYDALTVIRDDLAVEDLYQGHFLDIFPNIALLWRLSIIREIVLSGFQLELYKNEEKTFAYWYTATVISTHLDCLDGFLLAVVDEESDVYPEMVFQVQFLTALQSLCEALFITTMPLMSLDWERVKLDFFRRYKWAFREEYDDYPTPVVAQPDLSKFLRTCAQILQDGKPAPGHMVDLARLILKDLLDSRNVGSWAGPWSGDRRKMIQNLVDVCDNLSAGLPKTADELDEFDARVQLKWDPCVHPWFPSVVGRSVS
ncbi:Mak10-domain-containing protein [Agrocybe pediades]|nr:Mak10-domain-containing protein [Agrocybe pediades]